jgi:hypothetical protein
VKSFAFPFGAYNDTLIDIASEFYSSTRPFEQGENPQGTYPYNVKVRGVLNTTTPEEVESWLKNAADKKEWVVLVFHALADSGDDAYYTDPEIFEQMMGVVKQSGTPVITYDEGVERFAISESSSQEIFRLSLTPSNNLGD